MRKIFSLILVSVVLTSVQAKEHNLTFNLQKGKEYRQVIKSKATIVQEVNGQLMNMVMTINGGLSFFVVSVNPTNYDLDVKYESLGMSMAMPQGKAEFSSEKPDEQDVFSMILSKMIGKTFKVKMAKDGKVIEVKNIEPMIESLFEDFSDIPEDQLQQLKNQINKSYGAEAFRGNIEMVTAIFPENPVKKGEKWTIKTNLESGMSALMTTEYKFAESTTDYAMIEGVSVIETTDKDVYVESNGMPMKYDMKGQMMSEIKVDRETGWIIEANISQEIAGDAYIKENAQLPDGMKIPMTMINEMVITNK